MSSTYFTDSVSDLCQGIIDKVDTYEKRIKYLGEENKKLKDEHYKDSEMQRMEAELKKAKEDLYRGFPISEKEQEKIREWELKHDAEKHGLKTMEQRLRAGGFFCCSSALCRSSWKRSCNWCINATGSAERYLCCVQTL